MSSAPCTSTSQTNASISMARSTVVNSIWSWASIQSTTVSRSLRPLVAVLVSLMVNQKQEP